MSKIIAITSGKGGTGKTMFVANIGAMLAKRGHKVCVIDMDTGLRNLDLYLGLENNVVYDVADVLNGVCRIKQALIKHKSFPGLFFMAASPKPDEGEFTPLHMQVLCAKLSRKFDYIVVDCPAGLDDGLAIAEGQRGSGERRIRTFSRGSSGNHQKKADRHNQRGQGHSHFNKSGNAGSIPA